MVASIKRRPGPYGWRARFSQIYHGQRFRRFLFKLLVYGILLATSALVLLPFFWMMSTALKRPGTEFAFPIEWIPRPPRWSNFVEGWTVLPFNTWAINTLTITGSATIGHLISSALVGFGFARIRFPGREICFLLVLSTMMLPHPSVIIPNFLVFKRLGWIDTFRPLIVPAFLGSNAFFIFLLRQFFRTIPTEMDDAARVDGCSTLGIFRHIALPLSRPALGIILVFSFMNHWNDFMGPLIYLSSTERYTLALGLRYFQGQWDVKWTLLMATSLIIVTPCILLFFIAQKYYIQGIVVTGLKG